MIEEFDEFYTKTMAESYVQQGYLAEAAEIYQHLIDESPDDQELRNAFFEVKTALAERSSTQPAENKDISSLMCRWFELMLTYKRLKKINTLKLVK